MTQVERLKERVTELEAALREYLAAADNCTNPPDGDDVAAMLRFGKADENARRVLAKGTKKRKPI